MSVYAVSNRQARTHREGRRIETDVRCAAKVEAAVHRMKEYLYMAAERRTQERAATTERMDQGWARAGPVFEQVQRRLESE